jgi:hypothetical protein
MIYIISLFLLFYTFFCGQSTGHPGVGPAIGAITGNGANTKGQNTGGKGPSITGTLGDIFSGLNSTTVMKKTIGAFANVPANATCEVLDLTTVQSEIQLGNPVVEGLGNTIAKAINPINVASISMPPQTFSLAGSDWTVGATLDKLVLNGIDTLTVSPTEVVAPTKLNIGGSIGVIDCQDMQLTVTVNDVKFKATSTFKVYNSSMTSLMDVQVMTCAGGTVQSLSCALSSASSIYSIYSNNGTGLAALELMRHMKSAHCDSAQITIGQINVESITLVDGNASSTSATPNQVLSQAIDAVKAFFNSPGFKAAVENILTSLVPVVINAVIDGQSANFQSKCQ